MKKSQSIIKNSPAIIAILALLILWQALCTLEIVPAFMIPSPIDVFAALYSEMPILLEHAKITLTEAFWGLMLGVSIAFIIATTMERFQIIHRALYPIVIITQTVPTVAIAPLLVLWMGFDMAPKIALVALTTFFPVTIGLLDGYASTDKQETELLKSMGANRRQIYFNLKLPSAASHFFSGLRISASYAVVGAVVSEWLGGLEGLGVYMTRVRQAYAFDKMFAVIVFITITSLLLMIGVMLLRKVCMPWEKFEKVKKNG